MSDVSGRVLQGEGGVSLGERARCGDTGGHEKSQWE